LVGVLWIIAYRYDSVCSRLSFSCAPSGTTPHRVISTRVDTIEVVLRRILPGDLDDFSGVCLTLKTPRTQNGVTTPTLYANAYRSRRNVLEVECICRQSFLEAAFRFDPIGDHRSWWYTSDKVMIRWTRLYDINNYSHQSSEGFRDAGRSYSSEQALYAGYDLTQKGQTCRDDWSL
jgi:hypothetical protein